MHYIEWLKFGESEVSYTIYDDKRKAIYSEDVISDWEDTRDIEMTGIEIARSRGYYPIALIDTVDDIPNLMSELGKKSWEARKGKQDMSAIAKLPRKRKKIVKEQEEASK